MRKVPESIDLKKLTDDARFVGLRMHLSMGMRTVVHDRGTAKQFVDLEMCWTLAVSSKGENSKRWKHQITLVAEEGEGPAKLLTDVASLYTLGDTPISRESDKKEGVGLC